jgi:hypothetical protein
MDREYSTQKRNGYALSMGKPEGKRPLGKSRHRWGNNIRTDLGVLGWGVLDWIHLALDMDQWRALLNTIMNLRVPEYLGKFSSS